MRKFPFFKLNTLAITFDIASITFGVIGVVLGILSLLTLDPNWYNPDLSYELTVIAIVFDSLSCITALTAFILGYRYFLTKKEKIRKYKNIFRWEVIAIFCDFFSFFLGLIGIILEIISLVALMPSWNNQDLSYNVTIGGVIFDILSALLVGVALYFVLTATKKLNLIKNNE